MPRYDAVIFDLDGTLTDSAEGIIASVRYALERMGESIPGDDVLRKFIGPPLTESFARYCGFSQPRCRQAVSLYRERYERVGWLENRVYPGVRALLKALRSQGCKVFVATGKPQATTERILAYYDLLPYIDAVAGPTGDGDSANKKILIERVLAGACPKAVMIGDRAADIAGAQAAGIEGIGAGYGFGEPDEFSGLSCRCAQSVQELFGMLLDSVPQSNGYFITFEGLDGCGKTTQADAVEQKLRAFGYQVVRTREPGGCMISEKIRELLLDVKNTGMGDITEALLYAASRAQHVNEVILPAIRSGKVVLCDRFVDSSVAFQGGGRELGVELIQRINAPAIQGCLPNATVYLRLDHETALARRSRASALDRIEQEKAAFHARVEAAYDTLMAQNPQRFITVDARKDKTTLTNEIWALLFERLKTAEVSS